MRNAVLPSAVCNSQNTQRAQDCRFAESAVCISQALALLDACLEFSTHQRPSRMRSSGTNIVCDSIQRDAPPRTLASRRSASRPMRCSRLSNAVPSETSVCISARPKPRATVRKRCSPVTSRATSLADGCAAFCASSSCRFAAARLSCSDCEGSSALEAPLVGAALAGLCCDCTLQYTMSG